MKPSIAIRRRKKYSFCFSLRKYFISVRSYLYCTISYKNEEKFNVSKPLQLSICAQSQLNNENWDTSFKADNSFHNSNIQLHEYMKTRNSNMLYVNKQQFFSFLSHWYKNIENSRKKRKNRKLKTPENSKLLLLQWLPGTIWFYQPLNHHLGRRHSIVASSKQTRHGQYYVTRQEGTRHFTFTEVWKGCHTPT